MQNSKSKFLSFCGRSCRFVSAPFSDHYSSQKWFLSNYGAKRSHENYSVNCQTSKSHLQLQACQALTFSVKEFSYFFCRTLFLFFPRVYMKTARLRLTMSCRWSCEEWHCIFHGRTFLHAVGVLLSTSLNKVSGRLNK